MIYLIVAVAFVAGFALSFAAKAVQDYYFAKGWEYYGRIPGQIMEEILLRLCL